MGMDWLIWIVYNITLQKKEQGTLSPEKGEYRELPGNIGELPKPKRQDTYLDPFELHVAPQSWIEAGTK